MNDTQAQALWDAYCVLRDLDQHVIADALVPLLAEIPQGPLALGDAREAP